MSNETLILNAFGRLRGSLGAMARRITGNSSDADDVLQDAFVKLWQHRDNIDTQAAADGMSVVTVRNTSIDAVRRSQSHPTTSLDNVVVPETPAADTSDEFYSQVHAIIEQELTPVQQTIMRLREVEGMTHEEIAAQLDMTPVNVRVQLSRARKQIREIYRKRYNNE